MSGKPLPLPPPPPVTSSNTRPSSSGAGGINSTSSGGGQSNSSSNNSNNNRRPNLWSRTTNSGQQSERTPSTSTSSRQPLPPPPTSNPTRDRWNSSSTNRPTLFQQQQQQRGFLINKEKDLYQKLDARASSAQISTRPAKPSMLGNSNISGSGGITTGSNSSRLYSSGGGSGNTSSGGAGGVSDGLNSGSSSSGGPRMGSGGGPSQLSQFQKRRSNFDGPGDNSNNQTYLSPKRPRLMNGGGGGGGLSGSSGKDRYQQQSPQQSGYSVNTPNQGGVPRRSIFGSSATYDEYKRRDNHPSMLRNDGGSGGYGNDYRSSNYNSYSSSGGGYSRGPGGMGKSGLGGSYGRSSMLNPNNHPSSTRDYHPPSSNTGFNRSSNNGSSSGYNNNSNSHSSKHPSQNASTVAKSATSSAINIKINNNNARNISIIGGSKVKAPTTSVSKEEQEEELIVGTPDNYEDTPTMRSMEEGEEEEEEGEIDLEGEDEREEGEGDLEEEEEEEEGAIDDQQLQMEEDDEAAAAEAEALEQASEAAANAQESETSTIAASTSTSTAAATTISATLTESKPKPIVRKPFGTSIDISAVTARILAENQERAKQNSRKMLAELKEAVVPVVIRKNVQDYPCIQEILTAHKKFKPHLQEYIADRKQEMEEKRLELRQEYADHYATYKKKMAREKKRKGGVSSAQGPALAYGINNGAGSSSALGALSGEYGGGFGTRSSRRGGNSSAFTSDAVKSEAEWEQVLAAIAATEQTEADDSKLIALTVPDPPMITDPLERHIYNFHNFNRLVLDPVAELANVNAALEMKWSDKDRELFRYKLVQYGKDFPKIASYMGSKTTQDCVQYYYREKFSGSFKQLLRKAANSRANMRRRMNMAAKKPPITKSDSRASMTSSRNANSNIEEREQHNDNQQEQPQSSDQEVNNTANTATPTIMKATTAEQSKHSPTSTSDKPPTSTISPTQPTQAPTPSAAPPPPAPTTRSKPKPRQPQHHALAIEETSKFTISDIQDSASTRWTVDEKSRAFSAFSKYGRDFEAVATAVGSKTTANVSEFYQLYKRKYKLDAVVAEVEAGKLNGGGKDGEKKSGGGGSGKKGKHQVVERGESVVSMDVDGAGQGRGVEFVKQEEQQQQQQQSSDGWLKHERDDFMEGLRMYGCNWDQVSKIVGTKSVRKCRALYQSNRGEFDSVLLKAGYKPENSVEDQTGPLVQTVITAATPAMVYQTDQSGSYVYYAHPQPVVYAYAQVPPPQPQQVFHPMHGYHDPIPGQYAQPQEYPGASYAVGPYLDVRGPQFGPQGYAVYGQPVFYQGAAPPAYGTQQQHHEAQQYHQQQQQHIHQQQIQQQQQHQLQQEQNARVSLPPQQPQPQQQNNGPENTVLPSIRNLISD
ncbi:UNVERIFIED_CONTAM: nuclear receptor co-repressor 1 [Siphonaria sp. JEL0065]|nr:nuclear receptor co-repressor 1 [Siphonaria sp. JEL0065]